MGFYPESIVLSVGEDASGVISLPRFVGRLHVPIGMVVTDEFITYATETGGVMFAPIHLAIDATIFGKGSHQSSQSRSEK